MGSGYGMGSGSGMGSGEGMNSRYGGTPYHIHIITTTAGITATATIGEDLGTWALVTDTVWAVEWEVDMVTAWAVDTAWAWAMAAWVRTWTMANGPRGAEVSVSTRRGTPTTTDRTALLDPAIVSPCA